jgi:hypothetical protein
MLQHGDQTFFLSACHKRARQIMMFPGTGRQLMLIVIQKIHLRAIRDDTEQSMQSNTSQRDIVDTMIHDDM